MDLSTVCQVQDGLDGLSWIPLVSFFQGSPLCQVQDGLLFLLPPGGFGHGCCGHQESIRLRRSEGALAGDGRLLPGQLRGAWGLAKGLPPFLNFVWG